MTRIWILAGVLGLLAGLEHRAEAQQNASRVIPRPLPSHPGNIFLAGEELSVPAPGVAGGTWRAVDYEGTTVATGQVQNARVELGKLPVGYYELICGAGEVSNRVTIGVLAPLQAPTPMSSPIGIDVAMAWFFPKDAMAAPANLCALAGMNRVRDRLSWPELEPKRGEFPAHTRYDDAIGAQLAAGLQILEVNHLSPSWANPNTKRFPTDLRDAYNLSRELARRWAGKVEAIEPWNEADIDMFGGHTGSEMASLQKAAYFGLKAGNPNVVACLNVFAIRRATTLKDFNENEAWPYFDTFNLHHYEVLQHYPSLYADFRAVSGGKPMWVTECSVHVQWQGDEKLKELSAEGLRLQSERVTKTFALGLFQGPEAIFYFMLPQYTEGQVQFGLIHGDLTPRPGYLALAAVGRLLADAKPLGRLALGEKAGQAYVFDAKPDGKRADVAVVWGPQETSFELPAPAQACYDHLGRERPLSSGAVKVTPAPLFLVFAKGALPTLVPPPEPARKASGEPTPVVLQALFPESDIVVNQSAYRIGGEKPKIVPIFVYNFGAEKATGRLRASGPEQWRVELPGEIIEVGPGERKELRLNLSCPGTNEWKEASVRITGDFGEKSKPLLALRFVPESTPAGKPARQQAP